MNEPRTVADALERVRDFREFADATGLWNGRDAVQFSVDGINWSPVFRATDEHPHPWFAKITIYRKDVAGERGIETFASWEDATREFSEEALQRWLSKPVPYFGANVERRGIAAAFPAEFAKRIEDDATEVSAEPERDWDSEIEAATSIEQLVDINLAARRAPGYMTKQRERRIRERRRDMTAQQAAPGAAESASTSNRPTPLVMAGRKKASAS